MAAVNPSRSPCDDTSNPSSLAIAALADIYICYRLARPAPWIGILFPGFAAALVAIGMSWWLLSGPAELPFQPPVAFVAGVLGPLVGADLSKTGGECRFRRRSVGEGGFFSLLYAVVGQGFRDGQTGLIEADFLSRSR